MTNAIDVQNLTVSYPGFQLKDVTFNVEQGSIVGFVGENGADKRQRLKLF